MISNNNMAEAQACEAELWADLSPATIKRRCIELHIYLHDVLCHCRHGQPLLSLFSLTFSHDLCTEFLAVFQSFIEAISLCLLLN
jgi:hypothetical protein